MASRLDVARACVDIAAGQPGSADSVVYFIEQPETGLIKIGVAKRAKSRLAALQTGSAAPMYVLALVPGDRRLERHLHGVFRDSRVGGEWFTPTDELLALVEYAAVRFNAHPQMTELRTEGKVRIVNRSR